MGGKQTADSLNDASISPTLLSQDVRRKRYSVNYVLGPEDGTTGQKRFSMNYQDFIQARKRL